MEIRRHFFEYTLTPVELQTAVGIFSFIFTATGILAVVNYQKDKRKMAWIISLLNSFVLSVAASVYLIIHIPSFVNDGRTFHSVDNVAVLISVWLCLANIFDLLFGLIFYRAQLDPLTAYVHHTLYVWITIVAAFGTGGFATFEPFARGVAALLVEEIPTFLLALGSVFPSMRTDLGFGVTFLLFRILFHAAMMGYSIWSGNSALTAILFMVTMTMHMFWFLSWVKKYGSKSVKKGKNVKTD